MQTEDNIQWSHSHNFGVDTQSSENKVKAVFWLTTIIMVLEIAAGTWSGSMALLADGWHMGTHSAAFAITIFAYSYAKKHVNNKDFSFGTGKVNHLGGFASAIALAIVALMMAIESILRLVEPQQIYFNEAIVVAIIGLCVNVASVFLLHDDHHHHHHSHQHEEGHVAHEDHPHADHEHHHDHNMKAAYFHVLADTLTSILAIVALLAGKYFGLIWMDALMGIVGACVIFRWSYGLIKESSDMLLDKSVDSKSINKAVNLIKQDDDTIVKDIHIWHIAPSHQAVILSVETTSSLDIEDYKQRLKLCLPRLSHTSIEIRRL
jgi:cation diffusion facilitator family transporter